MMDGFRTAEMLSGEQKGMRRRGPQPGTPNAADPATVLQRGFSIRLVVERVTGRRVRPARQNGRTEKPLGWQHDQPGQDASFSTNRPLFRVAANPGKARRTRRSFRGSRPASQETCHPRAWCPHWGGLPVASTEVVVATFCIRGSLSTRRCRSACADGASIVFLCMLKACTAGRLRAVEGHGAP